MKAWASVLPMVVSRPLSGGATGQDDAISTLTQASLVESVSNGYVDALTLPMAHPAPRVVLGLVRDVPDGKVDLYLIWSGGAGSIKSDLHGMAQSRINSLLGKSQSRLHQVAAPDSPVGQLAGRLGQLWGLPTDSAGSLPALGRGSRAAFLVASDLLADDSVFAIWDERSGKGAARRGDRPPFPIHIGEPRGIEDSLMLLANESPPPGHVIVHGAHGARATVVVWRDQQDQPKLRVKLRGEWARLAGEMTGTRDSAGIVTVPFDAIDRSEFLTQAQVLTGSVDASTVACLVADPQELPSDSWSGIMQDPFLWLFGERPRGDSHGTSQEVRSLVE